MKFLKLFSLALGCLFLLHSCTKDDVFTNRPSQGTLKDSSGNCLPSSVHGTYEAGIALSVDNYLDVHVNVDSVGSYTIATDSVNGYYFKGTGTFGVKGDNLVRLYAHGKPDFGGVNIFTVTYGATSCTVAVTASGAAAVPANYTVDTLAGACSGAVLDGVYATHIATTVANKVTLHVVVTTAGLYNITTATVNGISFSGRGAFTSAGAQNIVLTATGTPTAAGAFNYTVTTGSVNCIFSVNAVDGPSAASFTLGGGPSACAGFALAGTYKAATVLTSANTVSCQVNVTSIGVYSVTTNTVNGISFSASGTFTVLGTQTITLTGSGTPISAGNNNFTVTAGASTCTFSVTTAAASGGAAVFTLGGAGSACTGAATAGTFTAGTALTASNILSVQVNITTVGTYTISTNTVNGILFSKTGTFTATGIQTVALVGTGTPLIAGSNNFTITAGSSTCTFSVTINPGSTPLTDNIYVGGFESNGTKKVAKVWHKGVPTILTDGTKDVSVDDIFVSGTDVHATGTEYTTSTAKSLYWKNGVVSTLTAGPLYSTQSRSVFLSGTDVYAAGFDNYVGGANIWKNGTSIGLSSGSPYGVNDAMDVFVSGSDVYAAGWGRNSGSTAAVVWKNGNATSLTTGVTSANAFSVYVSGTDVYVGGWEDNASFVSKAMIWKNGVGTVISTDGQVNAVFVSGGNVYAGGMDGSSAAIWKNGTVTHLTTGGSLDQVNDIYVVGSDVYAAGFITKNAKRVATIWKNGVATYLTDGTNDSELSSIVVK